MAKRARRGRFGDFNEAYCLAHPLLDHGFMKVMPAADAAPAIGVSVGVWLLAGQGARHRTLTAPRAVGADYIRSSVTTAL
jgi:hypothetical protein